MGKKSNAKKKLKQPNKKEKQPKTSKAEASKTKPEKIPRKINKQKIFGAVLALIMLAILVSTGYLLFQRAFRPSDIAKYLPGNKTVLFLEVNLNFDHAQSLKTWDLLEKYPNYSKKDLISFVEGKLQADYEKDLRPWVGRQGGMALIKGKNGLDSLYFVETLNADLSKTFFQANQKGNSQIYESKYPFYLTFMGDYIFFSLEEGALKDFLASQEDSSARLSQSNEYDRISDNMPLNRMAFLFINYENLDDSVFQYFSVLGEMGLSESFVSPLLKSFKDEGISLAAVDSQFAIQSFLTLDVAEVDDAKYLDSKENYDADLLKYLSKEAVALWGGENLSSELKRMVEMMAGGSPEALTAFESLAENYAKKYFGDDASFDSDIAPLFENEFVFAAEINNQKTGYKVVFELSDAGVQALSIQKLADSFAEIGAIFEPKVVSHTLEDGTETKEIVAVPEEIKKSESQYKGMTIYQMETGEGGFGIYYSFNDKIAVIATDQAGIRSTIDLMENSAMSLKNSSIYSSQIDPVISNSDELVYFNFENLMPLIFSEEEMPEYLKILGSLSSGKIYFNDGLSTINFLRLK